MCILAFVGKGIYSVVFLGSAFVFACFKADIIFSRFISTAQHHIIGSPENVGAVGLELDPRDGFCS